jgi:hypothetical protein
MPENLKYDVGIIVRGNVLGGYVSPWKSWDLIHSGKLLYEIFIRPEGG